MKLKKILKNNKRTEEFLSSLPTVYLIGCWAHCGIMEYPFAGELVKAPSGLLEPMVYKYADHNGAVDQWELMPLHHVTTGLIFTWTFHKNAADKLLSMYLSIYENKE